jgi:hypothetical protein
MLFHESLIKTDRPSKMYWTNIMILKLNGDSEVTISLKVSSGELFSLEFAIAFLKFSF